jgi:hypothetical protein
MELSVCQFWVQVFPLTFSLIACNLYSFIKVREHKNTFVLYIFKAWCFGKVSASEENKSETFRKGKIEMKEGEVPCSGLCLLFYNRSELHRMRSRHDC